MPSILRIDRYTRKGHFFSETLSSNVSLFMVEISAGFFTMGSPDSEEGRKHTESPQRLVNLSRFFMGRYPITQAQWRAVAIMPQIERELNLHPADFNGVDHPVEKVNWYEAVEFCARLSAHSGRNYTLPSESQWEYACRAGMKTPFHFGETLTTGLANYDGTENEVAGSDGSYGRGSAGEKRGETTPVGQFPSNDWGLFDMHGNVREWCLDDWHDNYEGAPENQSEWLNPQDSSVKVLRGGSWLYAPKCCRSAARHYYNPYSRLSRHGFRVVCLPSTSSNA